MNTDTLEAVEQVTTVQKTDFERFNEVSNDQVKEGKLLGKLLWWAISEGNVSIETINAAANEANIPAEYLPRSITGARAFKRAMDQVVKTSKKGDKYSGLVVTKIVEDSCRIIYSIHEREVDRIAQTVSIDEAEKITYLKETNVTSFGEKYSDQIQEMLEITRYNYTANDIRAIVTRLVHEYMQAITVRDKGGVYFVPNNRIQFLNNVDKFIELTVGGGIFSFPVFAPERKQMSTICIKELVDELDILNAETQEALEDSAGPTKFTNRLERYEEYRDKVHLWAQIMEFRADELYKLIAEHKQKISDLRLTRYSF